MKKILLLAGEESGLFYAKKIAEHVRARCPDAEIRGYADYGFQTGDLAVMGIVAVVSHFFYFLRVKRTMERAIDTWRPDVVCTIDYPGMNMRLGAYAKERGIRAVHVVCPQVWAWKRGRIPRIERSFDALCCFFPFEPSLFRAGFATFVGHPLVEEMASEASVVDAAGSRLLALLPGSRLSEIRHHMPVLLGVVGSLAGELDAAGVKVEVPAANEKAYVALTRAVADAGEAMAARLTVRRGGARALLRRVRCAVVASGTATLEAAMARCPTVLVYKVDWLFAKICRLVIKGVRHIGLANVIAEMAGAECPMVELLQEDMTVENVVRELRPLLFDPSARNQAVGKLDATMALLRSEGDSMTRIADFLI